MAMLHTYKARILCACAGYDAACLWLAHRGYSRAQIASIIG